MRLKVAPQAGNQSIKSTGQEFKQPVPKVESYIAHHAIQIKEVERNQVVRHHHQAMIQFTSLFSLKLLSAPKCLSMKAQHMIEINVMSHNSVIQGQKIKTTGPNALSNLTGTLAR